MKAAVLLLACLPAAGVTAADLAHFTCARPTPWDPGSAHNVSVAAARVNGTVLPPGAEFSFLGAVADARGYVPGTSFLAGREVKSVGGGICQVSSGLYNAALLAGLDIVSRSAHSLYDPTESYVPPGRDAMVTGRGHVDFRFRNSTAAALTILAAAQGGTLTVGLEGVQGAPRRRWIETRLLRRVPKRVVEIPAPALPPGSCRLLRPGFDGLVVDTSLCRADAQGVTRCADLGVDRYRRVDQVWQVAAVEAGP